MVGPVTTALNSQTGNQENTAFSTDCAVQMNGNGQKSRNSVTGTYTYLADLLFTRATSTAGKRSLVKCHYSARDAGFVYDIRDAQNNLDHIFFVLLWDSGTPLEICTFHLRLRFGNGLILPPYLRSLSVHNLMTIPPKST